MTAMDQGGRRGHNVVHLPRRVWCGSGRGITMRRSGAGRARILLSDGPNIQLPTYVINFCYGTLELVAIVRQVMDPTPSGPPSSPGRRARTGIVLALGLKCQKAPNRQRRRANTWLLPWIIPISLAYIRTAPGYGSQLCKLPPRDCQIVVNSP